MASFGLLGAIGGAAQGAGQALQSQLEQDRKLRLEELRTSNNRETNRMSNEQRHELSLAELKARGEQGKEMATFEQELKTQSQPRFEDSEFNGIQGQRNTQTGEFKPVSDRGPGYRPSSKLQEAEYLRAQGVPEDQIQAHIMGGGGKQQVVWREEPVPGGLFDETQKVPYQVVTGADGSTSLQPLPIGEAPQAAPADNAPRTFDEAFKQMQSAYPDWPKDKIERFINAKLPQLVKGGSELER